MIIRVLNFLGMKVYIILDGKIIKLVVMLVKGEGKI